MNKNYYDILGVPKDADRDTIKKAYKKNAKNCHPDKFPNDKAKEDEFKELSHAHEILTDPKKKTVYDKYGVDDPKKVNPMGSSETRGYANFHDFMKNNSSGFNIHFDGFDYGVGHQQGQIIIENVEVILKINIYDAFKGSTHKIEYTASGACDGCSGKGYEKNGKEENCVDCNGQGKVIERQQIAPNQFYDRLEICKKCHGSGTVIINPCKKCKGQKVVMMSRSGDIDVPLGVKNRTFIKLTGHGNYYPKINRNSDLIIMIAIGNDDYFSLDDHDVYCKIPISLKHAIYGSKIIIPTLHGKKALSIPKGTKVSQVFRMKNFGMPKDGSGKRFGDLYINTHVEIPDVIDDSIDFMEGNFKYKEIESFAKKAELIEKRVGK